jgi:hypothetical protein
VAKKSRPNSGAHKKLNQQKRFSVQIWLSPDEMDILKGAAFRDHRSLAGYCRQASLVMAQERMVLPDAVEVALEKR